MPEPTACARARSYPDSDYCDRCDLLVGPDGFHVIDVAECEGRPGVSLPVVVESPPRQEGCRVCGVIAHSHGRRTVRLVDAVHGTAGGGGVAQADLALRRIHLPDRGGWTELEGDLARPRAPYEVQLRTAGAGRTVATVSATADMVDKVAFEPAAGDALRLRIPATRFGGQNPKLAELTVSG